MLSLRFLISHQSRESESGCDICVIQMPLIYSPVVLQLLLKVTNISFFRRGWDKVSGEEWGSSIIDHLEEKSVFWIGNRSCLEKPTQCLEQVLYYCHHHTEVIIT